jgi:pseudouridine kinase
MRAKNVIGKFTCIKPNIMEAEALSGIKIKTEDDVKNVGQWFVNKGVKKVFITLNRDGVYYKDSQKEGFIRPKDVKINSATGAGDSFSATILIGMLKDRDIKEMAKYGMAAAQITMESSNAVSKNMNKEEIERRISNV